MLISQMTTDFEAEARWQAKLVAQAQAELNAFPVIDRLECEARELELLAVDPPVELALGQEGIDWKAWRSEHHRLTQKAARLRRRATQLRAHQATHAATHGASRSRAPGRTQSRRASAGTRRSSRSDDSGGSGGDSDPPPPTRLWAIQDLAAYLALSTYTVYTAHCRQSWRLIPKPSFYLGRHPRWRPADVERWLDECATPPPDDLPHGRRGGGPCKRS